jgi:exodeoxyribonuclease VII large subunit
LLSVHQVNDLIRGALAAHLPATLHVLGELGNLSRPTSGHVYFTLKDASSELRCVMWRSTAGRLKFAPEPGMAVIATGSIEVYAQRGTYQLIVRKLELRGVGALEVAFRQLCARLEREGLFDARRKKPLPHIPERVALVTSPSGAALRDMLHTLARRCPAIEVLVYPVRVQGAGAAEEIAAAIRTLNQHAAALGGIDVLITGRGGGSLEDLWAFNEEVVARAIAASRIPVVSAVGHEVDVTISDLVADLRAPTPTAAAELIAPPRTELLENVQLLTQRAARTLTHAVSLSRANLSASLAYDGFARPLLRLRQRVQLIDELQQRLRLATLETSRQARATLDAAELALLRFGTGLQFAHWRRGLEQRLHRLWETSHLLARAAERQLTQQLTRLERVSPLADFKHWAEHVRQMRLRVAQAGRAGLAQRRALLDARIQTVAACDPRQVLRRGYSLTRDARTRRLIRSVAEIRDRLRIVTELADGEFHATAEDPRQPNLFDQQHFGP